ncbi:IclR family transcriptional regulator [Halomonas cerina]|uniref:DNA-binding IclR family transcriptional regulator n=1 Tax=Halomonas cerina TaxID=447424 RepID=A0A839VES1_9GAMM|nr:IclR family transcriptional regulator [Halomonas cerina]MBB3192440.1 DNA-binding IclR family transcriptional regulator [Halomonas cerina]
MNKPIHLEEGQDVTVKDRNFVTALSRGLELLRAFGAGSEYLGNAELSSRTGIPRPTVSRLTYTLKQLGYLEHNERLEKYRLGAGVLALGYRYLASMGIRDIARPHLQRLADATDCAVALGTADRLSMTYIEVCQARGPLVMRLETGSRIPMATTAIGRAWLCGIPEERRHHVMDDMRRQDPDNWPAIEQAIQKALDDYANYGFCLSEGDWERDISAVATPLVLEEGSEVMAINCGGSSLRLSHRILVENLGPRLKDVVEQIKRSLEPPRLG